MATCKRICAALFSAALLVILLTSAAFPQATLTSDRPDYPPGDTVKLTGAGFSPGETVTLQVSHSDATFDNDTSAAHQPWQVTADDSGGIQTIWVVPTDQDELGSSLKATADGVTSGLHAEAFFTDAGNFSTLSVGAQTPSPVCAGSTATYIVTVGEGGNPSSNTVTLSITTALPSGVTASFSPTSLSFSSNINKIDTLRLFTSASTPASTTAFTVKAHSSDGSISDVTTGSSLVVAGPTSIGTQPTDQTACSGTTASFTVVASGGGLTYQWRKNGTNLANVATGNGSTYAGVTTATLQITNVAMGDTAASTTGFDCVVTGSCSASPVTSNRVGLTVNASPTANAGPDQSVCGFVATLAGNTPAVGSGAWSKVSGTPTVTFSDATSPSSTATVSAAGTVTLRWTVNDGTCTSTDDVVIIYTALPTTANAGPDQSVCGLVATLAGNSASVGTGTWTLLSGPGTITFSSLHSATSTATATIAGAYSLRWTIANGSCASTDTVNITYTATPTASNAGPDQNVCGLVATLAGNAPSVGSGTWTQVGGTGTITFGNANSPTSTATASVAGSYTLRWTIANGSCTSTNDVIITYTAAPTTANAGTDQSVCGLVATMAANTPSVGTGSWAKVGGPSGTVTFSPSGSPTATATVPGAGTYQFRWTITNGSCSSADTVQIVYTANPTTSNAGPDQSVCGLVATLAGNLPSVGTGTWTQVGGPGTVTFSNSLSRTSTATASTAGSYTLRWTIANGSCTSTDDVIIAYTDLPTIANAGPDQTVCGLVATLAGNTPSVGTGSWSKVSGTPVITFDDATSPTANATASAAGSVTLRWTISNGACTSTNDVLVTYNIAPSISSQPASKAVCAGSSTTFSVTATGTSLTYQWRKNSVNLSNSGDFSGVATATLTINPVALGDSGTYDVVVSGACPPSQTSNPAVLTVNPSPDPTITAISPVCGGSSGNTASVPDAGAGATYAWTINGGTITLGAATRTVTYTAGTGGSLTLNVTVTNSFGCPKSGNSVISISNGGIVEEGWKNSPAGSIQWQTSTLQAADAVYPEGGTIPFRFTLPQPCVDGSWSLTIQYDFSDNATGVHFFDFLTTYNASESSVNGHECDARTCSGGATTFAIPSDPALFPSPGYQVPGQFMVQNGTITSAGTYSTIVAGGVTSKQIILTGTATPGSDVVLLFGGHLARDNEWGANKGAAQWPSGTAMMGFLAYSGGGNPGHLNVKSSGLIDNQTQADLSVTKSGTPNPVNAGSNVTYSITVNNAGPGSAIPDTLVDPIPSGTTFVSTTTPSGWIASAPSVGGTGNVIWTRSTSLVSGGSSAFGLVVNVNSGSTGTVSNTATASSGTADPNRGNNSATAITTITPSCTTPQITGNPANDTVCSGGTASFSASGSGTPTPSLQWQVSTNGGSTWTNTGSGSSPLTFTASPSQNGNLYQAVFTNACGSVTTTGATLIVNTAPVITCPANFNVGNDPGACGAVVNFISSHAASATGNPAPTITYTPASGSSFAIGSTVVKARATNSCGVDSCTFTVTVADTQKPTISCPGNKAVNTSLNLCTAVVNGIAPLSSSDNCPGAIITYALTGATAGSGTSDASGTTFSKGVTTVKYKITDASGNKDSCSFTVAVNDNQPPIISGCPSDQTVYTGADRTTCDQVATWTEPTATDNCDGSVAYFSRSHAPGSTFPKGITTVSYIYKDAAGNADTCKFTVTVIDNTPPEITGCPSNQIVYTGAGRTTCDQVATWTEPTATDNCDGSVAYFSRSHAPGSTFAKGVTTVSYIFKDAAGNEDSCKFTVTVIDNTPPAITGCPSNQIVYTGAGRTTCDQVATWTEPTATDNCDGSVAYFSRSHAPGSTFAKGVTTVSYIFKDAAGNEDSCKFTVTVIDNTPPAISGCPSNQIVYTGAGRTTCDQTATWTEPSATDNCDGSVAYFSRSHAPGSTFPKGVTTVSYIYKDAAGNEDSCKFTVTVIDNTPPAITGCPSNQIVYTGTGRTTCDQVATWTEPSATDNCDGSVAYFSRSHAPGSTFDKGVTTVRYIFKDAAGNEDSCKFTVTVIDNTPPAITGCPSNQIVYTGAGRTSCDQVATWTEPSATDNCDGSVAYFSRSHAPGSTFPKGVTTVSYIYKDAAGNEDSCKFTVTVIDNTPPAITGCPSNQIVYTGAGRTTCDQVATWTEPSATDNCDGSVAYFSRSHASGSTFSKGVTTVSYIFKDAAGNADSCKFTVTVIDNTPPVISGCPTNQTVYTGAGRTTCDQVATWTEPTATDNCDGSVAYFSRSNAPGSTFGKGTSTVTYIFKDAAGNADSCKFNVTVIDNTPPVISGCPSNQTVYTGVGRTTCDQTASWTAPTATDNCAMKSMTSNYGPGATFPKGLTTVTYTACDSAGNKSYCNFTITVIDNTPPVITGCPSNITVYTGPGRTTCDQTASWTAPTATDNCAMKSFTPNYAPGATFPKGTTTVTYTATDSANNTSICSFTVTVIDNTPPVISGCPSNMTVYTGAGRTSCDQTASWTAPTAADNCGVASFTSNYAPGATFSKGTTTVTYTAKDAAGDSSMCSFTVTVIDNTPPVISCPPNIVTVTDPGLKTANVSFIVTATDNCPGVGTVTCSPAPFTNFAVGTTTVNASVMDASGNKSTCSFTVTVSKRKTKLAVPATGPTQYSDKVPVKATLTDSITGNPISGESIAFTIGAQSTAALTDPTGLASSTLILSQQPSGTPAPSYAVVSNFSGDSSYAASTGSAPFTIARENAAADYSGLPYFSTGSTTSTSATITLSATVTDTADGLAGNVTYAKVEFHRDSPAGALLGTANLPVGLVNPGDLTVGSATTTFTYTLSSSEVNSMGASLTIYTVVGGYYTGVGGPDEVTISIPGSDKVSGGGYLVTTSSAGKYRGKTSAKSNFGYTMQYTKSGSNLKGQANIIVRAYNDSLYQIKSNAINSMTVVGNRANFSTKANLTNITNPLSPISLGGNMSLTVEMTDSTTGGQGDSVSITLQDPLGGLLFSSNWNGTKSILQSLRKPNGGGNVKVMSAVLSMTGIGTERPSELRSSVIPGSYTLYQNFPNPFNPSTEIRFDLPENSDVSIIIYDVLGHEVQNLVDGSWAAGEHSASWYGKSNEGWDVPSGIYFFRLSAHSVTSDRHLAAVKKMILIR